VKVSGSQDVLTHWEQIKTRERAEKAQHSALDDIPRALPALMRSHKIQKRCSNVGFDWHTLGPVLDKVYEEIDEVMHEAKQAVVDQQKLEEEIGDLLFATVNLSRHLGSKAEIALQKASDAGRNARTDGSCLAANQSPRVIADSIQQKCDLYQPPPPANRVIFCRSIRWQADNRKRLIVALQGFG
jgi:uncharacterized protein YabN with tetrapyrrole methylase and pyrophosphatase domain